MSRFLKVTLAASLSLMATSAFAGGLGLGRPALPDEIAAWDIDVRPDGQGLPDGRGDVLTGEEIFLDQCAVCHGDFGEGAGRWPVLTGGTGSLTDDRPVKTTGSYWPYLSTVYDYINRAMPFGNAQSLQPDEVYAITAYLLYMNDLVDEDFELSHENFAETRLPNEDNFFMDDRDTTEYAVFKGDVCMTDCKEPVKVTMRAAVLDVTPEETAAKEAEAPKVEVAETNPEPAKEEPVVAAAVFDPELAKAGEKVFKKCKACHQVGEGAKNRTGPILNGVMGRAVGGLEGFRYSKVMASHGGVWDDGTLAEFLKNPKKSMKGTKMSFAGLKKEKDVLAVTEYLKSFGE